MSEFTTADGTTIRFEVLGSGPAVLVCHGGPNNVYSTLRRDLEPLASRCMLVFHDYRGSGHSDTADAVTYHFEQLADDLDELREHLDIETPAVLAHSMGGFVALHHALRHPERCGRLALVGTTPCATVDSMLWPTLRALGPMRTAKLFGSTLYYLAWWSWRGDSPDRERARARPMQVTQEPRRALRSLVTTRRGEPVPNDNAEHLMAVANGIDLRPHLGDVTAPTLVVYGTRDAVMVAGAQHLRAGLPNATAHALVDVGHEPFIESPQETFDLLVEFLASSP